MIEQALELLTPWTEAAHAGEISRGDLRLLDAAALLPAVRALVDARWGYLAAITGLDPGVDSGELEILYHFCEGAAVLTLRVRIPRELPDLPSLCPVIPSALLYEIELREMFGVRVLGLPDDGYLFLPDDWQAGLYPLRKDAALG